MDWMIVPAMAVCNRWRGHDPCAWIGRMLATACVVFALWQPKWWLAVIAGLLYHVGSIWLGWGKWVGCITLGRPFEGATVRRMVRRVAARTMIRKAVHPHLFRHSIAMNMLRRGAHLMAIRHQLGHEYIETTMLYLRDDCGRSDAQYEMYCPSYS